MSLASSFQPAPGACESPFGPLALELVVTAADEFAWPTEPGEAAPRPWYAGWLDRAYRCLTPTVELPWVHNFGSLGDRLCRGAQPGRLGLLVLKAMGVDTVINLRAESSAEAPHVRGLGMRYRYFPLDPLAAPTHPQTLAFLHAVTDPTLGRVYFHCYHGADRTGVLAACYRLAHDGWPMGRILAELELHHFHHAFQAAKLSYLAAFAAYWADLPAATRSRIMHAPAPAAEPPALGASAPSATAHA